MHTVVQHPLLQHKITLLRDIRTREKEFRELANEATLLLAAEALQELPVRDVEVETPLTRTLGKRIAGEVVLIPVLRAGIGMLNGIYTLVPNARVGFVGMYRDPRTKQPVEYYMKLPLPGPDTFCVVIDPMLATGGSIVATVTRLKEHGFRRIVIVSILAAPEGLRHVEAHHADVPIYLGALDDRLDENKYILPGLGDAGDRLFGTPH